MTPVEMWPLSRIVEYARNPRKNDAAVDRMCASIREFGFKIPCLVRSDGELFPRGFVAQRRAFAPPLAMMLV